MNENNNNTCCIANTLCIIAELQNNAEKFDCGANTCDRRFLGNITGSAFCLNTRPVSFYTCNGTLVTLPYTLADGTTGTSSVFRVEKVDGCCASMRILADNPDTTSDFPYIDTGNFFTIDTNCICILRCLGDTFVPGV